MDNVCIDPVCAMDGKTAQTEAMSGDGIAVRKDY